MHFLGRDAHVHALSTHTTTIRQPMADPLITADVELFLANDI